MTAVLAEQQRRHADWFAGNKWFDLACNSDMNYIDSFDGLWQKQKLEVGILSVDTSWHCMHEMMAS